MDPAGNLNDSVPCRRGYTLLFEISVSRPVSELSSVRHRPPRSSISFVRGYLQTGEPSVAPATVGFVVFMAMPHSLPEGSWVCVFVAYQ
jgi:hypothetical protein